MIALGSVPWQRLLESQGLYCETALVSAITGGLAGGALGYWTVQVTAPEGPAAEQLAPSTAATDQSVLGRAANAPAEEESGMIAAVQRVQPAVVTVLNQGRLGFGSGSGVIISEDGYIVTNNHVVEGASELGVVFFDGRQADATLIGTFELTDLAVIRVDELVPAVAELGDSDALQPGARVIAIGSPLTNIPSLKVTYSTPKGITKSPINLVCNGTILS